MERRALYNSVRMNWLFDPSAKVQSWQVEDYRKMPLEVIFERLKAHDLQLDKLTFLALAETADTPEDLNDDLIADYELDNETRDKIYLLVFELWRRFKPEKPCLSVFCDELDHQIFLYDRGETKPKAIQDILARLELILEENTDSGATPREVFATIASGCANEIESFIYDFISEQIDSGNLVYAQELIDDFSPYVTNKKWLDFLSVRLMDVSDHKEANQAIRKLIKSNAKNPDLEFNLELLSFVVESGEPDIFLNLVKNSIPLLDNEEDALDLFSLAVDYYHRLDLEKEEKLIQQLIDARKKRRLEDKIDPKDHHFSQLLKICETR